LADAAAEDIARAPCTSCLCHDEHHVAHTSPLEPRAAQARLRWESPAAGQAARQPATTAATGHTPTPHDARPPQPTLLARPKRPQRRWIRGMASTGDGCSRAANLSQSASRRNTPKSRCPALHHARSPANLPRTDHAEEHAPGHSVGGLVQPRFVCHFVFRPVHGLSPCCSRSCPARVSSRACPRSAW